MPQPVTAPSRAPQLPAVTPSAATPAARAGEPPAPRRRSTLPAWLELKAPPAITLRAAAEKAEHLAQALAAKGDHRAIFPAVYAMQMRDMIQELRVPGRYHDPDWMEALSLDFAQRYFDTFEAYERGDRQAVPHSWLVALDHGRARSAPIVNNLLLSMNAHINHDLPLSVAAAGMDPIHHVDFKRFNEALKLNVERVQALLSSQYLNPKFNLADRVDRLFGPLDEWVAGGMIENWRARAWLNAAGLSNRGREAYGVVTQRADWNADVIHRLGRLVPASWARRGLI
ncbi:MAG: DUF5995 family protein [Candidatus Sericytochromatia bacterium]|nr:DUF5995 family protein [Candidatus Sericytochromatia bacterium]